MFEGNLCFGVQVKLKKTHKYKEVVDLLNSICH